MRKIYNYETLNYAAEAFNSFKEAFKKYEITEQEAKANFLDGGVIAKAIRMYGENNFCQFEHIAQATFDCSLTFKDIVDSFRAVEIYDEVDSLADFEEDIQDKIYNYQVREIIRRNTTGVIKRWTAIRAITRR